MTIRLLEGEEKNAAVKLVHDAIVNENGSDEKRAAGVYAFLKEHTAKYEILACGENEPQGILIFEPDSFQIAILIAVPEFRHQGIGTALLDELRSIAAKANAVRLTVNAADSSIGFYERYGFEKTGEIQEAGGHSYVPMEYLLQREHIGRTVTVTIDRPYGSFHPHYPDVIYELNFGYVDELISPDGNFQDAWIIGVKEPLETFRGIVAGIIYHREGTSRFIVTRCGELIDREAIIQEVAFEEQYYDTRFVWNRAES